MPDSVPAHGRHYTAKEKQSHLADEVSQNTPMLYCPRARSPAPTQNNPDDHRAGRGDYACDFRLEPCDARGNRSHDCAQSSAAHADAIADRSLRPRLNRRHHVDGRGNRRHRAPPPPHASDALARRLLVAPRFSPPFDPAPGSVLSPAYGWAAFFSQSRAVAILSPRGGCEWNSHTTQRSGSTSPRF